MTADNPSELIDINVGKKKPSSAGLSEILVELVYRANISRLLALGTGCYVKGNFLVFP